MNVNMIGIRLLACLAAALAAGCQTVPSNRTDTQASVEGIPKVTALYEQATATHVHRYRKPLRDRQARLLRQLERECDKLLASVRTGEVAPQALTGQPGEQRNVDALEVALLELRDAAGKGDIQTMRSAHATALTAYQNVHLER